MENAEGCECVAGATRTSIVSFRTVSRVQDCDGMKNEDAVTQDKKAVLLLVFNRPDHTSRVIEAIKKYQPRKLYISGDGPRRGNSLDSERCHQVRQLVEGLKTSFPIEVQLSEENRGCRKAVVTGIDWFFGHEEDGIILEDDCLPTESFFHVSEVLLDRLRDEEKVWGVGGSNFAGATLSKPEYSYGFTSYPMTWGWATWRNRWLHYDRELSTWPPSRLKTPGFHWNNWRERFVFTTLLHRLTRRNIPDTWDYQWIWTVLSRGGAWVSMRDNLIENIGFGPEATHTTWEDSPHNRQTVEISELIHPNRIEIDPYLDFQILTSMFGIEETFFQWLRAKVRNIGRRVKKF